jgi:hypothetical protein
MFNNPELDAVKARYFKEDQRPSISTVISLRDMEKKDAEEEVRIEYERRKKRLEDEEKLRKYNEEQSRLKAIQQAKEALPYQDSWA